MSIKTDKLNFDMKKDALPIFARHETFHPRFGWLKKGYDKVKNDKAFFVSENASALLGVGKNMVKSIKYWCLAFNVVREEKNGNLSNFITTEFAEKLLDDNGWDPYLEHTASLWLLHWQLFKPIIHAPAWFFMFNDFKQTQFNNNNLIRELQDFQQSNFKGSSTSVSSLSKDLNCILRMYSSKKNDAKVNEDSINSPFIELNLINELANGDYSFNIGNKPNLPNKIIMACCLEFASLYEKGAKTINISRLLYESGSPGLIFKINESTLYEALEAVSNDFNEISIINSSGLIQLAYSDDPTVIASRLLDDYYNKG